MYSKISDKLADPIYVHKTQAVQVMVVAVMITVILFHYKLSLSHDSQFITEN